MIQHSQVQKCPRGEQKGNKKVHRVGIKSKKEVQKNSRISISSVKAHTPPSARERLPWFLLLGAQISL